MGERLPHESTPRSRVGHGRAPLRPVPFLRDSPRSHPYPAPPFPPNERPSSALVNRQFNPRPRTYLSPQNSSVQIVSPVHSPIDPPSPSLVNSNPVSTPQIIPHSDHNYNLYPPSTISSPHNPQHPSIQSLSPLPSSSPLFLCDDPSSFFSSSLFSPSSPSPIIPPPSSSPVMKVDQATSNPYNHLATSDVDSHVSSLFCELADRVGNIIHSTPNRNFPRFVHCDKSRAVIRNMAYLLSPCNPIAQVHMTLSQVCNLMSYLTGIPPRQIRRLIDDPTDHSMPLSSCPPCRPPPSEKLSKQERDLQIFTPETRGKMRFFIHAQFREQRRPTLEMVVKAAEYWLQGDDVGRSVSVSSLRKCMRAMGFSWRKLATRCHMYLNPGVSSLRNAYLTIMTQVRSQTGAQAPYIAFLDETWLYPGMRHSYGWADNFADNDPFLAMQLGLTPGLEAEFKKGERLVLIGVFSEEGFVHYKVYRTGKKEDESTRDYHGEMNAQVFESYAEKAFPVLAQKAKAKNRVPILVIDNASYHGRRLEAMPTKSSTKGKMVEFLNKKGISFNPRLKRPDLYSQVIDKLDKTLYNKYATEEIAKRHGVRLIRLPPYHCVYSPIELAWAWLKNKAKDVLTVDDAGAVAQRKVEEIFASFPVDRAPSYMDHCRRKEQDHIEKGSLTFSHEDLDPHAFVRAQMRADRDLDTVPARLDGEEQPVWEMEEEEEDEGGEGRVDQPDREEDDLEDEDDLYEEIVIEDLNNKSSIVDQLKKLK